MTGTENLRTDRNLTEAEVGPKLHGLPLGGEGVEVAEAEPELVEREAEAARVVRPAPVEVRRPAVSLQEHCPAAALT